MKIEDLRAACLEPNGLDGAVPEHLYLQVPKKSPPGQSIRLAGRTGPLGRVCNAKKTANGFDVVAVFQRKAILAFISEH